MKGDVIIGLGISYKGNIKIKKPERHTNSYIKLFYIKQPTVRFRRIALVGIILSILNCTIITSPTITDLLIYCAIKRKIYI